jgi:hypothetical protein
LAKSHKRKSRPETSESRVSEGLTVVWMMSVMTTLLCGLAAAIVLLAARGEANRVQLFGRLLHFSAFVSAILSLLLLAAVLKFREQPPPPAITWSAVAIALAAIGTALLS